MSVDIPMDFIMRWNLKAWAPRGAPFTTHMSICECTRKVLI